MSAWRETPTLRGAHVILRPLLPEDRDAVVATTRDGDLTELFFTTVSSFIDPDAAMAALFKERDFGRAMPFVVETPDGRVVGMTRYLRMNAINRRLEIGGTFYAASAQRTVSTPKPSYCCSAMPSR